MHNDQRKIWDHFQGAGVHSFDKAVPRLKYLFRRALCLAQGKHWTVLNIGTGNGWLEDTCHQYGWIVYSLDPSELAVKQITSRGIAGQVGLIEQSPYQNKAFNAIFCSEVFEHLTVEQMRQGLNEIYRMLAAKGYLIGTVPFQEDLSNGTTVCPECGNLFHRWGHQQSFTRMKMKHELSQADFRIKQLGPRAFPYFARSSPVNTAKTQLVIILGRMGVQAAFPALCFVAQKVGA